MIDFTRSRPRKLRALIGNIFLFSMVFIGLSTRAQAYIDPGSGSVLITAVLGIFGAIAYTFRKYFYRLKRLFSSKKDDDPDDKPSA